MRLDIEAASSDLKLVGVHRVVHYLSYDETTVDAQALRLVRVHI